MDINRIKIFLKLSQSLHFSQTAEEMGIAQSALSHQITLLEKELECSLFDRSNRWNVTLTPAGEEFVKQAKNILETVQKSIDEVKCASRGEKGILKIALNSSALNADALLKCFYRMSRKHSGIVLKIREEPSQKVYDLIQSNQIDLGFLRLSPMSSSECEMKLLTEDMLVMAMPKRHPLAKRKKLAFSDFAMERFILPRRDDAPLHRAVFDQLCDQAGFTPKIVFELESQTTILRLLESCACVSMVPLSYANQFEQLIFRELTDHVPFLPESAIWLRDNPSKVLKIFLSELFS